MENNELFVEQMPFFEALYGKGKAVIDIAAFEKWFSEFRNSEEFEQDREQSLKRDEFLDDDPFFSDNETFNGPAPHDLSENHDNYLYGKK